MQPKSILIWLAVAAVLLLIFSQFSSSLNVPALVLLVLSLGIIAFYVIRSRSKERSQDFSRRTPLGPKLISVGVALLCLAVVWAAWRAGPLQDNSDALFWQIIVPIFGALIVGGVLIAIGLYSRIRNS